MSKKLMNVQTGIPESEQESSYQNGALHQATDGLAITIDVCPNIPKELTTEAEVKAYIEQSMKVLTDMGWRVNAYIGKDSDAEDEEDEFDMLTVVGYETEDDYSFQREEGILTTNSEEEAAKAQKEYEDKGYYLVTTTDNNGKLR